jgi:class 3 adenylate cyclase
MERLKTRLEEFKPEDTEIIERLKKDIEKAKNRNDKLVKILKQYTSKSTWKYLIHRILTHANPDDESDKETFVLEDYGTMVFGDIHGFTKFSERFNPEEVFISLNQMYDIVTRIVYEFDGDIDKFIGDAFFAVFKDPLKAVKSVIKIAKGVDELNDERMMKGHTPLFFRFGINSGRAVRGDIGGELRRENTLIGDSVNIAQRLESSSIPGQILISESTYELVKTIL